MLKINNHSNYGTHYDNIDLDFNKSIKKTVVQNDKSQFFYYNSKNAVEDDKSNNDTVIHTDQLCSNPKKLAYYVIKYKELYKDLDENIDQRSEVKKFIKEFGGFLLKKQTNFNITTNRFRHNVINLFDIEKEAAAIEKNNLVEDSFISTLEDDDMNRLLTVANYYFENWLDLNNYRKLQNIYTSSKYLNRIEITYHLLCSLIIYNEEINNVLERIDSQSDIEIVKIKKEIFSIENNINLISEKLDTIIDQDLTINNIYTDNIVWFVQVSSNIVTCYKVLQSVISTYNDKEAVVSDLFKDFIIFTLGISFFFNVFLANVVTKNSPRQKIRNIINCESQIIRLIRRKLNNCKVILKINLN